MVSTLAPASPASALAPHYPPPLIASALAPRDAPPTLVRVMSLLLLLLPLTPVLFSPLLLVRRDHIRCRCGYGRINVAGVLYGRAT